MTTYQVSQETANKLLYQAWNAFRMADLYLEDETLNHFYMQHAEKARAYYNAWSMVTGIEFEFGYYDLCKFTEDDFAEAIEAEEREILQEQLDEFEECGVAFLL